MQQFHLSADGFKRIKKFTLSRVVLFMLLAFIGSIAVSYSNYQNKEGSILFLPTGVIGLTVILLLLINWFLNRSKESLQSFTLTLKDNTIIREQLYLPTVTIPYSEVSDLRISRNGSIRITGAEPQDRIAISPYIEKYDELLEALKSIGGDDAR